MATHTVPRRHGTDLAERSGVRRWDLPATAAAVACAREQVCRVLAEWELTGMADDAAMVVSEIVTNAVLHTVSTGLTCWVWREDGRVLVQVGDQGSDRTVPVMRRAADDDEGGRGLLLVDALSDEWGYSGRGDGCVVWAVLAAPRR